MDKEMQIELLMKDRCTHKEAEKFLKNGTQIWNSFEEWAENLKECGCYSGQTLEDVRSGKVADVSFVDGYIVEYVN